jgi:hypothetical protein
MGNSTKRRPQSRPQNPSPVADTEHPTGAELPLIRVSPGPQDTNRTAWDSAGSQAYAHIPLIFALMYHTICVHVYLHACAVMGTALGAFRNAHSGRTAAPLLCDGAPVDVLSAWKTPTPPFHRVHRLAVHTLMWLLLFIAGLPSAWAVRVTDSATGGGSAVTTAVLVGAAAAVATATAGLVLLTTGGWDSAEGNGHSGSHCETAQTIGNAPRNCIPCPECRHHRHDPSSLCRYYAWFKTGKERVEWKDNSLTRRRRQGSTRESDTAASMRVWPLVQHKYPGGTPTATTSASSSATGGPAASETDACTMGVAPEDMCTLLALANAATTDLPSSPHPDASPSAPCHSPNRPDVVTPEPPTIQVCYLPSLPPSLPPSLQPFLTPSLPPSFLTPSLPPSLPPSPPPFLPIFLPP